MNSVFDPISLSITIQLKVDDHFYQMLDTMTGRNPMIQPGDLLILAPTRREAERWVYEHNYPYTKWQWVHREDQVRDVRGHQWVFIRGGDTQLLAHLRANGNTEYTQ
jgi:hypothetical protein